jgi:predicted DCC family thiol-disulfide oxidoreductase YuxK
MGVNHAENRDAGPDLTSALRYSRMHTDPADVRLWLLYDGDCGFCKRWVNWVKRRGADRTVRFVPCQSAVELRQQAQIEEAECGRAAYLVEDDGKRVISKRRAAAAINGVLARLPGGRNAFWRGLASLYHIPGINRLEEIGYRVIARNRHRLGNSSCDIES